MQKKKSTQLKQTKKDPTVTTSISMPKSLLAATQQKSKDTGITISFKVQQALKAWIEEEEKK